MIEAKLAPLIFQFYEEVDGEWVYYEVLGSTNKLSFPKQRDRKPPRQFSVDPWALTE